MDNQFSMINLSRGQYKVLYKEFKVSRQSVYFALKGFTQSDLAKAIRNRARELVREEANRVEKMES